MKTFIALLRGINVGGKNPVRMPALTEMCKDLGFTSVTTYIQSGNVVFNASENSDPGSLISRRLLKDHGFEVPVVTFTLEEFESICNSNPFANAETFGTSFLHCTLLPFSPPDHLAEKFDRNVFLPDRFHFNGRAIYLYCSSGYGSTKLTNGFFEKKLGIFATTRNWRTMNELLNIAKNIAIQK